MNPLHFLALVLTTLFFTFNANPVIAACGDGKYSKAGDIPFFKYGLKNKEKLLFCGYIDESDEGFMYAMGYDLFLTGADEKPIPQKGTLIDFGKTEFTRISYENGNIQIEEIFWLKDKNGEWDPQPFERYEFNLMLNTFTSQFVFKPRKLSDQEISKIVSQFPVKDVSDDKGIDHIVDVLHASVSGSDEAKVIFLDLEKHMALNAVLKETYSKSKKVYQSYTKKNP